MLSLIKLSLLSLLVGLVLYDQCLGNPIDPVSERCRGRLLILYDNNVYDYRLKSSWGFACLVELEEKTILFDTGGDGEILLYNMRVLNKDPKTIDMIVLSHIHGDHTGGLWGLLRENPMQKVYIRNSFSQEFERRVKDHGAEVVRVEAPLEIDHGIYSTGEMDHGIKEQSLLIHSGRFRSRIRHSHQSRDSRRTGGIGAGGGMFKSSHHRSTGETDGQSSHTSLECGGEGAALRAIRFSSKGLSA